MCSLPSSPSPCLCLFQWPSSDTFTCQLMSDLLPLGSASLTCFWYHRSLLKLTKGLANPVTFMVSHMLPRRWTADGALGRRILQGGMSNSSSESWAFLVSMSVYPVHCLQYLGVQYVKAVAFIRGLAENFSYVKLNFVSLCLLPLGHLGTPRFCLLSLTFRGVRCENITLVPLHIALANKFQFLQCFLLPF